jgi:hypothetical protein
VKTEIWFYDLTTWRSSRILCTKHCSIVSATLSPDFSFILFTTYHTGRNNNDYAFSEYFETSMVDIRIPDSELSNQYIIYSGKEYQYPYVFFFFFF